MTFEISADYALIRGILTEPHCWRRMTGDRGQESRSFEVGPRAGIKYVIARDEVGMPAAVFLLVTCHWPPSTAEVHFCFTPATWGKTTEPIARAFLAWVWENTPVERLLGAVPSHNRLALRLALAVGFTQYDAGRGGLVPLEIRKP